MKILLFDGFSILNRAFYALPMLSNSSGEFTNAIYGFLNILLKFVDEEKPDFVTVAFDLPAPTFRHEMYGAYKGTRKGMPDELRAQVEPLKILLEKMGVHMEACAGFEADDIMGTLAKKAEAQGIVPVIITGDRDMLQLASDTIKIRLPKTKAGKTEVEDYHAAQVLARYGVSPAAFVDVKALMGDTSDNIPGVPGIGEVTATKIISTYGSLENALENLAGIKPKKAQENLTEFKEQAILSRKLALIETNAPVELALVGIENMWNEESREEILRLELKSLYKRIGGSRPAESAKTPENTAFNDLGESGELAQEFFDDLVESGAGAAFFPIWGESSLIGLAVATSEGVRYAHADTEAPLTLENTGEKQDDLLLLAKSWLESDAPKWVFDAKNVLKNLRRHDINPRNIAFDVMLAAYVLDSAQKFEMPDIEELLSNKGKRQKDRQTAANLPKDIAAKFAALSAKKIATAYPIMTEQLAANGQEKLFYEMEMPLAALLADMEDIGVKLDKPTLVAFGEEMDKRANALTALIYDFAGEEFNINSPAQLGEILFTKLGLKGGKKTMKGYSTAADVLEKLQNSHAVIPLVIEYRAVSKLRSTYVDGMLPLVNSSSSRIHTTFHQALTATGRLSSAEPNLQNIPVRTALGRELRKAFVAENGKSFLDADYSQIELRILAHISGDETLIRTFRENADIHRLTASQVLGISPDEVTPEQRNNAKAVNFGIVYGISAFGLSEDLKIPMHEAKSYIEGFYAKYPGVKKYMDDTVKNAKETGFVATLYNRRRVVPELRSSNFNTRGFGERVAMNMPIQGTAADIMKIAMLNVDKRLRREGLATRIVLQVHDELLLEAPLGEAEKVRVLLKEEMENAAALSVPLTADVNIGESWYVTK